jgi:hypothetical protein
MAIAGWMDAASQAPTAGGHLMLPMDGDGGACAIVGDPVGFQAALMAVQREILTCHFSDTPPPDVDVGTWAYFRSVQKPHGENLGRYGRVSKKVVGETPGIADGECWSLGAIATYCDYIVCSRCDLTYVLTGASPLEINYQTLHVLVNRCKLQGLEPQIANARVVKL